MGIGVSVFIMAVGAVLAFAVDQTHSHGFDLNAVGAILMIVGAIGLITSMIIWGPRTRRTTSYVEGDVPPVRQRRTYVEEV